jgi:hypothetical protein
MYKITINYDTYLCSYGDLTEVLTTLQKIRKLESNGKTTGVAFSVEEAGDLTASIANDAEQYQRWWLDGNAKVSKLEARIKELEAKKDEDIPF